jgi:hypothetical protein
MAGATFHRSQRNRKYIRHFGDMAEGNHEPFSAMLAPEG